MSYIFKGWKSCGWKQISDSQEEHLQYIEVYCLLYTYGILPAHIENFFLEEENKWWKELIEDKYTTTHIIGITYVI